MHKKSKTTSKVLPRILLALLLSLMLALSMAACSSSADEDTDTSGDAAGDTAGDAVTDDTPSETAKDPVTLQIFAANSLEKAMPEVQALYTEKHSEVTFAETQFKASGDLVEQLKAGATADLLITASSGSMDTAIENGNVDDATRVDMFANDLIIVGKQGEAVKVSSLEDLKSADISKIAIGDSATVPAGQYANQSLFSIGLYTSDTGKDGEYAADIKDKVVLADKVGTAANYVATGDCQVGFVYTSDLYRYDGIEAVFTVPADAHKKILYPGAVLKLSGAADTAKDFLDFCLNDPDALKIWAQYGFEVL